MAIEEPCGSQRVTEEIQGNEATIRWCERTDGPCPFPGTRESRTSSRKCEDSPDRRLAVTYSDDVVTGARERLRAYATASADGKGPFAPKFEDVFVAVAALTACIGDEP